MKVTSLDCGEVSGCSGFFARAAPDSTIQIASARTDAILAEAASAARKLARSGGRSGDHALQRRERRLVEEAAGVDDLAVAIDDQRRRHPPLSHAVGKM